MSLTKRCHYIPCLWSAFWNLNYHDNPIYRKNQKARNQKIFSLNLKSNRIFQTTVENVFYEKKMSISEVDNSTMLDFVNRNMPTEVLNFKKSMSDDQSVSFLDYEGYFSQIDQSMITSIAEIITSKAIKNIEQKTELSYLIATTIIRNFKNINSLVEIYAKENMSKFELFWHLKQVLSNPKGVMDVIYPFVSSKWILHKSESAQIPLGDHPVLANEKNILFTISPFLLLEILFDQRVSPNEICEVNEGIEQHLLDDLMYRLVLISEREIIFHNQDFLIELKNSKHYREKNVC